MTEIDTGISADDRALVGEELKKLLADTYALYLQTQNFHWNVTGPMFNTLHLMFMEQYTELWTALDEIAERIRALGVPAPFGSTLSALASLEDSSSLTPGTVTRQWRERHAACFQLADEANDQPSADLLTQRLQIHEKTAWMCAAC